MPFIHFNLAFSARLRSVLKERKIDENKQIDFITKELGVSKKLSESWIMGLSVPVEHHFVMLAAALGVRLAWLKYGQGLR